MFRKLMWLLSICLISLCFFSLSALEYVDRNLFFSSKEKDWHSQEALVYQHATERILFQEFPTLVHQIQISFESSHFLDIQNIISNNADWISNLAIRDIKSGHVVFTSKTLEQEKDIPYPCVEDFYYLPQENSVLTCRRDNQIETFFHLSLYGLKQRIISMAFHQGKIPSMIPIHDFFLQGREIFLNIPEPLILERKKLLDQTNLLLAKKIPFNMYWKGVPITSSQIFDSYEEFPAQRYNFYYHPLFSKHPINNKQLFFILLFAFLGIITLLLGIIRVFRKSPVMNYATNTPLDSEEPSLLTKDYKFSTLSPKDHSELQSLITQVTIPKEGEWDSIENKDKDSFLDELYSPIDEISPYLNNSSPSINSLLQKYTEISYILRCKIEKDQVRVTVNQRMEPEMEYYINISDFLIPELSGNRPNFYVYKEAGKTTAIKFLLRSSSIDPMTIQGALILQYFLDTIIIHLFKDSVDPYTYEAISEETKSLENI